MKKVVLALSGGVDSAVAAHLLQTEGYQVYGLNLLTWGEDNQRENVQEIADNLKFPVEFLDIRKTFQTQVIRPFIKAYTDGLTPSPCVFCNRQVKWSAILQKADQIGAEFVATGHYARLTTGQDGLTQIWKAADPAKDQSYMLSFLTQDLLERTMLPLGEFTKPHIRQIAAGLGLAVSSRSDSQDLCFLDHDDARQFLMDRAPAVTQPGEIRTTNGHLLGSHQGLAFYTIGQRKGLPAYTQPLFVLEKLPGTNTLIVGTASELGKNNFLVSPVNWISGQVPTMPVKCEVKIRYRAVPVKSTLTAVDDNGVMVETGQLLRDVTPGQSAVFYEGEKVLGGGIIRANRR